MYSILHPNPWVSSQLAQNLEWVWVLFISGNSPLIIPSSFNILSYMLSLFSNICLSCSEQSLICVGNFNSVVSEHHNTLGKKSFELNSVRPWLTSWIHWLPDVSTWADYLMALSLGFSILNGQNINLTELLWSWR